MLQLLQKNVIRRILKNNLYIFEILYVKLLFWANVYTQFKLNRYLFVGQ